jgi:4-hydroxythreonine-4-phosphate dehydrogenase
MGYPAGIGAEVISKALASRTVRRLANFLIVGNVSFFNKACCGGGKRIPYTVIGDDSGIIFSNSDILFLNMPETAKVKFSCGKISAVLGGESVRYIKKAVDLARAGKVDMLVTGPINKHAAALSGFTHKGHTEFLAYLTNTRHFAMMLARGKLKVLLATTHLPVRDISSCLDKNDISDKLSLAHVFLKRYFRISKPLVAVCGLNPHAGDNGLIGDEEKNIIIPAIRRALKKGANVRGPLPADGVFFDLAIGKYDAVMCMYHDQGLVALKMAGRDKTVNITLGLPFIRTSCGHGTALDIAGKGIADPDSMKQAIKTAVAMFTAFSNNPRGK